MKAPASSSTLVDAVDKATPGKMPKWLPYVLVAVACAIVLLFVFFGAMRGGSGGSGASVQQATTPSQVSASSSTAYLAVHDGYVAIYTNSSAEPYKVTKVAVSDLNDDQAEEVDDHIGFSSVEEAQEKVKEYKEEIKAAKEEAEAEAKEQEAAEASAREAAAAAAAAAAATTTQSTPQTFSSSTLYVVNCNEFITLRSAPDAGSSEIDRIPLGAAVTYLEAAGNGFYKIVYEGQTGYGLASYLSNVNSFGYESTLMRVVNCEEWISLRTQPDTSASTIVRIPLGESVRFISSASNGFYRVSYNGDVGYALAQYLTEW